MSNKILYQSNSSSNTFSFVFALVLSVFVFFLCATQFSHSPGYSLLGMLMAFIYLLSRSAGSVIVFDDRFVILNKRLLPGFSDKNEFLFSGVTKIEANLSLTPATDALSFLFRSSSSIRVVKNLLSITNKDGSVVNLSPKIYKDELRKAIQCIHQHSRIAVEFQADDL